MQQTKKDPLFCPACIFWTRILCHAQLQVRLVSTSSTTTAYGKERFKAVAAPTLTRPSLQMGGAAAAPVRAG